MLPTGASACELARHPTNIALTVGEDTVTKWLKCGACSPVPVRYTWEYQRDLNQRPTVLENGTASGCIDSICDEGELYCVTEVK